jgi:hypothetical protein
MSLAVFFPLGERDMFAARRFSFCSCKQREKKEKELAHLVTVTPEVVLGANVLVRVFGLLGLWGHVGLVLPVLQPQTVGVDACEDEARNHDAVSLQEGGFGQLCFIVLANRHVVLFFISWCEEEEEEQGVQLRTRWRACARCLCCAIPPSQQFSSQRPD